MFWTQRIGALDRPFSVDGQKRTPSLTRLKIFKGFKSDKSNAEG